MSLGVGIYLGRCPGGARCARAFPRATVGDKVRRAYGINVQRGRARLCHWVAKGEAGTEEAVELWCRDNQKPTYTYRPDTWKSVERLDVVVGRGCMVQLESSMFLLQGNMVNVSVIRRAELREGWWILMY